MKFLFLIIFTFISFKVSASEFKCNFEEVYSRFGGVDGSAFYLGGVAGNYLQRDDIVMAPMRAGVGLRAGVSIGYLKFTRESGWFPF